MSSITIHNWQPVSNEGNDFDYVPPAYHPTYWEVPKWWYKGDRTVYTSCARVDFTGGYQIYIDGTTPRMQLTMEWDGSKMLFKNEIDIRRVLICKNLGEVNRDETTEYIDVYYNKKYPKFEIVFDGLDGNIDVPIDDPVIFTEDPKWKDDNVYTPGTVIYAYTGTFVGGTPPLVSRARFQTKTDIDADWNNEAWTNDVGDNELQSFTIPDGVEFVRFHHQVRETDKGINTNKFTSTEGVLVPDPIIVCTPLHLLPDLGDAATGQRVCYEGDTLILEDLELLPS